MNNQKDKVASLVAGSLTKPATAKETLDRLFEATETTTNTGFAEYLGISQASVSQAKNKGRIPADWIVSVGYQTNCSTDWLLFGEGPKKRNVVTFDEQIESRLKQDVPVVAFGPSKLENYYVKINTRLRTNIPKDIQYSDDLFAVLVPGAPVVPASQPSSTLFCDPGKSCVDGQLVYVERIDNLAVVGSYWSDTDDNVVINVVKPATESRPEELASLKINTNIITTLAVVTYVRDGL